MFASDGSPQWVRWQRIGGAAGILAVVILLGLVIWTSASTSVTQPTGDGAASDWLLFLQSTAPSAAGRAVVGQVAIFSLLTFLAALAVRMRLADGRIGVPSILLLLAGGMAATLDASGLGLVSYFRSASLDLAAANVVSGLLSGLSVGIALAFAGTLIFAGVGALESAALPRILGWFAIIAGAAWLLAGLAPLSSSWNVPYLAFLIWVIATSIVLLRSGRSSERAGSLRTQPARR